LQQLNALVGEAKNVDFCKGLMHIHCMINSSPVMAFVDTGATHNFIRVETMRRLLACSFVRMAPPRKPWMPRPWKGVDLWVDNWMGYTDSPLFHWMILNFS